MPPVVQISNLSNHVQQEVTLRGWLYGKRSGGKIHFLLVRDGTGICQCIVDASHAEAFAAAGGLGQESSLEVTGTISKDDRAPGGYEMTITGLHVLQAVDGYPVSRKAHGVDFLMNHRHLWLRSPRQAAILRIRHTIISAARRYFDDRGFTLIDTPLLTPGAAEGAGTLFKVDYFGEEAYLAQTGQLYLESAAMALGKVYCFGPTFRAEKSKTRRHLTEFWMVEPEIAFADLDTLTAHAEEMTCFIVRAVLEKHREDLKLIERDVAPLEKIAPPFPRMTYTDVVDLLHSDTTQAWIGEQIESDKARLAAQVNKIADMDTQLAAAKKGWQQEKLDQQIKELRESIRELEVDIAHRVEHRDEAKNFAWGGDLGGDEETIVSKQFDTPVFVTAYPRGVKAFYMKRNPERPDTVLNLDMLAPEGYGEIIGGSVREDHLDTLLERMKEDGMKTGPYEWYLDLRRYGSVPHGGYGLGIERTVAWICGLRHIRETIPFPRLMGRMYP
ncbi:MAG: asparagine--tRNA ligase [bacterium]